MDGVATDHLKFPSSGASSDSLEKLGFLNVQCLSLQC